MSIAMLHHNSVTRRQTLKDDLESVVYVVLYCGILWIRQTEEIEERKTLMNSFFGECLLGRKGGNVKGANKHFKNFIREFSFECADLNNWISTVCTFQLDPTKWRLEVLYEYWKGIASRELPSTDREDYSLEEDDPEQ